MAGPMVFEEVWQALSRTLGRPSCDSLVATILKDTQSTRDGSSRIQLALSNTGRAALEIGGVPIQMDLAEAVFLEVFLAFGSGRSDIPGSLPYFWDWLKRYSWKSSLLLVQCVPVNYGVRFGGPLTAHGGAPHLCCWTYGLGTHYTWGVLQAIDHSFDQ